MNTQAQPPNQPNPTPGEPVPEMPMVNPGEQPSQTPPLQPPTPGAPSTLPPRPGEMPTEPLAGSKPSSQTGGKTSESNGDSCGCG